MFPMMVAGNYHAWTSDEWQAWFVSQRDSSWDYGTWHADQNSDGWNDGWSQNPDGSWKEQWQGSPQTGNSHAGHGSSPGASWELGTEQSYGSWPGSSPTQSQGDASPENYKGFKGPAKGKGKGKGDGCTRCGSRWHDVSDCPIPPPQNGGGEGAYHVGGVSFSPFSSAEGADPLQPWYDNDSVSEAWSQYAGTIPEHVWNGSSHSTPSPAPMSLNLQSRTSLSAQATPFVLDARAMPFAPVTPAVSHARSETFDFTDKHQFEQDPWTTGGDPWRISMEDWDAIVYGEDDPGLPKAPVRPPPDTFQISTPRGQDVTPSAPLSLRLQL